MLINYANNREFWELERGLKSYDMLAYKDMAFTHIPNLRMGKLDDAVRNGDVYEIPLGQKLIDLQYKLVFKLEENTVTLLSIEPKEKLLRKPKDNMFKVNLLDMLNKDR